MLKQLLQRFKKQQPTPPLKTTILLLGTRHCDPQGAERLERALSIEQPDILTLESNHAYSTWLFSPEGQQAVIDYYRYYLNYGLLPATFEKICNTITKQNFEEHVALRYTQDKGIPLHYVDNSITVELWKERHHHPQKKR